MINNEQAFLKFINDNFNFNHSIVLGAALFNQTPVKGAHIKMPLKTLNRHGLIAGATGTGKTKTLQLIVEGLSNAGIPSLIMDVKGDLSGLATEGTLNDKIIERQEEIGIPYRPQAFPVELLSLSDDYGARLRATVSEFGPVLLAKLLELNDTQGGLLSVVFKYADDNALPLLDLKDLKKLLQYITKEGKENFEQTFGKVSETSVSVILRKIVEIEQQGADKFFGELSFDVNDLCALNQNGKGFISIVRLTDIQDKPKLFSTFMLCLLAEIYTTFPEVGDLDKPKLMLFLDEAHLIFNEANKALLNQIEIIIKLIRSKGVGIVFCTQNPTDIPNDVLSQLGFKIQHAIRAVTAKDRKALKQIAENFPENPYYQTEQLLTQLGIGQAAVTVLNEKGIPTPLTAVLLCAPGSRMGVLSDIELKKLLTQSKLTEKYNRVIDRQSAFEILSEKLINYIPSHTPTNTPTKSSQKNESTTFEKVINNPITKQIGRTILREVTRSILGVLGLNATQSRKKR